MQAIDINTLADHSNALRTDQRALRHRYRSDAPEEAWVTDTASSVARAGESTEIKPRKVTISAFEITNFETPNIHFKVSCSKGTYIRSLANDFGHSLNSGAHLSVLRRTKIGAFNVKNALSIDAFITSLNS